MRYQAYIYRFQVAHLVVWQAFQRNAFKIPPKVVLLRCANELKYTQDFCCVAALSACRPSPLIFLHCHCLI
jgi:hypothetical protein